MTEETVNEIKWTIHETHPDKFSLRARNLQKLLILKLG
jgi:hypothetical protein